MVEVNIKFDGCTKILYDDNVEAGKIYNAEHDKIIFLSCVSFYNVAVYDNVCLYC